MQKNILLILLLLAEKVYSFNLNNSSQIELDISNLKSGIYLLRIMDVTDQITLKK